VPENKSDEGPTVRPLSRAETRRVAELRLTIKIIDTEIEDSSSSQVIEDLRATQEAVKTELHCIVSSSTASPPFLVS